MTDPTASREPRKVWRRAATSAVNPAPETAIVYTCGGPDISHREHFLRLRAEHEANVRARKAKADAKAADEAKAKSKAQDEDADIDKAAERYRNDRYSVKLLRQDDNAWGGRGGDAGALG